MNSSSRPIDNLQTFDSKIDQQHVKDIGNIIISAQSELSKVRAALNRSKTSALKSKLLSTTTSSTSTSGDKDPSQPKSSLNILGGYNEIGEEQFALEGIIEQAEFELAAKAETVLSQISNQTRTLGLNPMTGFPENPLNPVERHQIEEFNIASHKTQLERQSISPSSQSSIAKKDRSALLQHRKRIQRQRANPSSHNSNSIHISEPTSPVEALLDSNIASKLSAYQTQLRKIQYRQAKAAEQKAKAVSNAAKQRTSRVGKVSSAQTILPSLNRRDPTAPPPKLPYDELAKNGVIDLVQRGFVPAHADISVAFAPLTGKTAAMHDPKTKTLSGPSATAQGRSLPTQGSTYGFNFANVKLDLTDPEEQKRQEAKILEQRKKKQAKLQQQLQEQQQLQQLQLQQQLQQQQQQQQDYHPNTARIVTGSPDDPDATTASLDQYPKDNKTTVTAGSGEEEEEVEGEGEEELDSEAAIAQARDYNQLLDTYSLHNFIIRRGTTLHTTPEFISFKRKYRYKWGPIAVIIRQLERLFHHFGVPLAYINGSRIVQMGSDELFTPELEDLLSCVVNIDEVDPLIQVPGRRYRGKDGVEAAVIKIQSVWRMKIDRKRVQKKLTQIRAAKVIQTNWRKTFWIRQTRKKVKEIIDEEHTKFSQIQLKLRQQWKPMQDRARIIIHVSSLSTASSTQRATLEHFISRQSGQFSRLTDLRDPLVHIIYVSPVPVVQEIIQYYEKLLQIGGIENASERYLFVSPENYGRLPEHFSLSKLLLYSPRALQRIRNFIAGRDAYIVPGLVGEEDIKLAVALGVPLLGPSDSVNAAYGSKSGARRIFSEAEVNIPIGLHDIYSHRELLKSLAGLIVSNITVPRWLIKLDHEFGGRGHAYFDPKKLKFYSRLKKEAAADPKKWASAEIQELATNAVHQDLVKHFSAQVVINDKNAYKTWSEFSKCISKCGAVIEATPASIYPTTSPSANIFIGPDGSVTITSTHEQVLDTTGYSFVGATFPQTSVPPAAMNEALYSIGRVAFRRGIIGYIGVDFIWAHDPTQSRMKLSAVDLNLRQTDTASSFAIFDFTLDGSFDPLSGYYHLPSPTKSELTFENSDSLRRYYVVHDYLHHSSMALMPYSVLFSVCRARGIAFDLVDKFGTIFSLKDSYSRGVIGMMSVGRSLPEAIRRFLENLPFLIQQISLQKQNQSSLEVVETNMREAFKVFSAAHQQQLQVQKEQAALAASLHLNLKKQRQERQQEEELAKEGEDEGETEED